MAIETKYTLEEVRDFIDGIIDGTADLHTVMDTPEFSNSFMVHSAMYASEMLVGNKSVDELMRELVNALIGDRKPDDVVEYHDLDYLAKSEGLTPEQIDSVCDQLMEYAILGSKSGQFAVDKLADGSVKVTMVKSINEDGSFVDFIDTLDLDL